MATTDRFHRADSTPEKPMGKKMRGQKNLDNRG